MSHKKRKNIRGNTLAQNSRVQAEIAAEAGRIMANEGVHDFRIAKLKARDRLRFAKDTPLPTNQEVQHARNRHLSLFIPAEQIRSLQQHMGQMALEAMEFFSDFKPELVSDFLHNPVSEADMIQLHLQTNGPEDVAHFLDLHNIPFKQSEICIHISPKQSLLVPVFYIDVDNQKFKLLIFTETTIRQIPRDPGSGEAQNRVNVAILKQWLNSWPHI